MDDWDDWDCCYECHVGYNYSDYDFCSYGERRTEPFEEDLSDGALD